MKSLKILFILLLCIIALTAPVHAQWKGTWKAQLKNKDTFSIHNLSPVDERVCWASTINFGFNDSLWVYNTSNKNIFYKTIDGGKTWQQGTIPIQDAHNSDKIVALSDKIAWSMFMGGSNKLFKTSDGGKTWVNIPTPLSQTESFLNEAHFWSLARGILIGDPRNGYFEIYQTFTGGQAWQRISESSIPSPLPDEFGLETLLVFEGNSCYFATTKGRVFASDRKSVV